MSLAYDRLAAAGQLMGAPAMTPPPSPQQHHLSAAILLSASVAAAALATCAALLWAHAHMAAQVAASSAAAVGMGRLAEVVGASDEDLDWFAGAAWGRRAESVARYDSAQPPHFRDFWQRYIATSTPVVIKNAATHAGWPAGRPWTRRWMEEVGGAESSVPLHVSVDRCWSRIRGATASGGGDGGMAALLRPARVELPLGEALQLIAADGSGKPRPRSSDADLYGGNDCEGLGGSGVGAQLESLLNVRAVDSTGCSCASRLARRPSGPDQCAVGVGAPHWRGCPSRICLVFCLVLLPVCRVAGGA
jgi:hypothetical protein